MLTNGTLNLEPGRTYWVAYLAPNLGIGSGVYEYTGRVDGRGGHEFAGLDDCDATWLSADEVTSIDDTENPAAEPAPTAASVGHLLEDEGLDYSVLSDDGVRSEGFYTADLTLDGLQVIGVYFSPPADDMMTRTAEVALGAYGLITNWRDDRDPQLVACMGGVPA